MPLTPHSSSWKKSLFSSLATILFVLMALFAWAATTTINYNYDNSYQVTNVAYTNFTTSTDYAYDYAGNRVFMANSLPGSPANNPPAVTYMSPFNNRTSVPKSVFLNYSATDQDGDPSFYSVHFGNYSTNMPLLSSGTGNGTHVELDSYTRYYWRVSAKDSHNATTDMGSVFFNRNYT